MPFGLMSASLVVVNLCQNNRSLDYINPRIYMTKAYLI